MVKKLVAFAGRAIRQALLIFLVAFAGAAAANLIRPESLDWVYVPAEAEKRVGFEQALVLWQQKGPVFVDAREPAAYERGHIKGSINFPYSSVMTGEADLSRLPDDVPLVLYCSGPECTLADDLHQTLEIMGYANVIVYAGGWNEWETRGGPTS